MTRIPSRLVCISMTFLVLVASAQVSSTAEAAPAAATAPAAETAASKVSTSAGPTAFGAETRPEGRNGLRPVSIATDPGSAERGGFPTNQPFASYWHPNDLLEWNPLSDPDAPYNRSGVPLANRFHDPLTQVNSHAHGNEGGVNPLCVFGGTSNNPSQGALEGHYYAFNAWQYVDLMIFWGGSAGEGLILAPNPGIIDAAHRNGVPILGTVFFPPTAFGGQIQWVRDFVQKDGDTFPVADKLIEVAEYYGFDGFFINQETAGGNAELAADLRDLMIYFQRNSDLRLEWYDAMIESGPIVWQERLNSVNDMFFQYADTLVSETMFLDFGWSVTDLSFSRTYAQSLGRSEFDLFAGVDVGVNGYNTGVNWNAVFPEGQPHVTSLGFYRPDWSFYSAADRADFHARTNQFWVGANGDPADTSTNPNWKGLAHYVPARSSIDTLPFVTHFGTGQGDDFYVDGTRRSPDSWSSAGWNNLSLQDVLPTWRWIVEGGNLTPAFDWTDAYYGGNCLSVTGGLSAETRIRLFKTELDVASGTSLDLAFKTGEIGATYMSVELSLDSNMSMPVLLAAGPTTTEDWNQVTLDLSAYAGDIIREVSVVFGGTFEPSYSMKIGKIAIHDGAVDVPVAPAGLFVDDKVEDSPNVASLRLRWTDSPDPVDHYDVYRRNPDASRTYLGGTANSAYFLPAVERVDEEEMVTIEVEAVGEEHGRSAFATTTFTWDLFLPPNLARSPNPLLGEAGTSTNAKLLWRPSSNAISYEVYFGTEDPPPFLEATDLTSADAGSFTPFTTYYWRVDPVNSVGTTEGNVWSFTTGASTLGQLTNSQDIGEVDVAGSSSYQNGTYTITGSGQDIWDTGDEFQYAFRTYSGDGEIKVYGVSVNGPDPWCKTGPMFRASYDPDAPFALVMQRPDNRVAFQWRDERGAGAAWNGALVGGTGTPKFMRLDRAGDLFTAYYSTVSNDGPWTQIGNSISIPMNNGGGILAGLAVTAHNDGTSCTAVFEDLIFPAVASVDPIESSAGVVGLSLAPGRPSPFRTSTTIRFDLPSAAKVDLQVHDAGGRLVRRLLSGSIPAGPHSVVWDGMDTRGEELPSGVYFYELRTGGQSRVQRVVKR